MLDKNLQNVSTGKDIFPFEMGYLPESFQQKALIKLKETTEKKVQGLKQIKELVGIEKLFDDYVLDDDFLLLFLRCVEFDVKNAFEKLKNAFTLKRDYMFMFTNQCFEKIAISFTNKIVTYLPYRCPDGCAILHINLDNWIPEEFPVVEVKRMAVIALLQALRDPMTQVNGFKVIFNAKSSPLRHLRHCTFQNLYLMYHGSQNCLPGKVHSYHLINQSVTSKVGLSLIRHFFSEELKRKIHVHSSQEELLKFFPPSVIPICYGGKLGDYDMTHWLKSVMQPDMLANLCGRPKS